MSDTTINLKETVNLPKTEFPIRAGLTQREPEITAFWEKEQIYKKIQEKQKQYTKPYILHDGPPYPNGDIHMGHALNKVLKDIVVRSKFMSQHYSPYVPGWDCHGLPIETQVIKQLRKDHQEDKKQDIPWFRNQCREFALNYVETQKKEFKQLGVFGEWEHPYLTLNPSYEAKVIELFGDMAENDIIYRGKKPIHWCPECETALAEAELEYHDHRSPSIYFKFKVTQPSKKLQALIQEQETYILVWTTTPWTLPSNAAIAAHPEFEYVILNADNKNYLMVKELVPVLSEKLELQNTTQIGTISGAALEGTQTQHPFEDRISPMVLALYVTKEDGTGFVHTAPGHGQEDYITGQKYKLTTYMPVDDQGRFTDEVPRWKGQLVFEANKPIVSHMEENGSLMKLEFIKHSYPHCWRCKKPVIFRATEQWFIAMDHPMKNDGKTLREKALAAIKSTQWYPSWGENRIYSMIENRPDWCISRQRYWGIPIPVLICEKCGHPEMTGEFNQAIKNLVAKEGTVAWFSKDSKDILPSHLACSQCGSNQFKKETDILDVWFESGSSFGAVLEVIDGLQFPAQMYLEGSDQHRGWFHSSLLIGIGARNQAPYQDVLTHGFIVDEKGQKMSKSLGNVISPLNIIKESGADSLRWWIVTTDFKNDVGIGKNILAQARDSYSKVRNTIRFLLSNLYDFDFQSNQVEYEKMTELDQWILHQLNQLIQKVTESYHQFQYHILAHSIHDFCAVTLSSLYLDIVKDRLYCDGKTSPTRRSTQTAIHIILDTLLRLLAPVLVFTMEDAYAYFQKPDKQPSIHLEDLPQGNPQFINEPLNQKWTQILDIKNKVYQKLELLRNNKTIRSFLEAQVTLTLPQPIDFSNWDSVFIVSKVIIKTGTELAIDVAPITGEKCQRCWKYNELKKDLCPRCYAVVYTRG